MLELPSRVSHILMDWHGVATTKRELASYLKIGELLELLRTHAETKP